MQITVQQNTNEFCVLLELSYTYGLSSGEWVRLLADVKVFVTDEHLIDTWQRRVSVKIPFACQVNVQ